MSENGCTKPLQLDNGKSCQVRRVTAGVMRDVRMNAHTRGFEDDTLDTIFGLRLVLAEHSDGEITDAVIDGIHELDVLRIWATAKGADLPNPLPPSSAGTAAKTKAAKKGPPTNG